jgi:hypothetical protein
MPNVASRSLIRVLIGASIGPFARFRLDKALGLSIGLWCVRFGEDLAETQPFAGGPTLFER